MPPIHAVPFTFAAQLAANPASFPLAPPIEITEDEDEVVERLFPNEYNARPAGHVPATPTVALSPDDAPDFDIATRDEAGPERLKRDASLPSSADDHLYEHEFSESEFAVDAGAPDSVAQTARETRSVWGALLVIGHLLLLNAISIPVTIIIIKRLGALGYGQWAAATELVALSSLVTTLGLRPLFVRTIAQQPEVASEELAHQLGLRAGLTLGASALAIGVVLTLSALIPKEYSLTVVTCAAIAVASMAMNVLSMTFADVLQGLHKMKTYSAISFVSGMTLTVASLIIAWKRPDPVSLSLAYMAMPVVGLTLNWIAIRRHMPIRIRFSLSKSRELLRESRTIGAYQISVVVRDRLERVLLPLLSGMSGFGFYYAGIMPADRLFVVPEGFITAFFPAISRAHHRDERAVSQHVLHLMVTSVVACTPLAILVTFLAEPIARLLFKADPTLCRDVIQVTIWAVPLRGLQLPMGCALQASGRHATAAKTGILATFVSLTLTIALIVTMGIRGACWAWVGRAAISTIFLMPAFVRTFPTVYPRVPILRILVGLLLMGGLLWASMQIHTSTWLPLVAGACAAVMVYFVAMILLRVIEVSDLKLMLRRRAT